MVTKLTRWFKICKLIVWGTQLSIRTILSQCMSYRTFNSFTPNVTSTGSPEWVYCTNSSVGSIHSWVCRVESLSADEKWTIKSPVGIMSGISTNPYLWLDLCNFSVQQLFLQFHLQHQKARKWALLQWQ